MLTANGYLKTNANRMQAGNEILLQADNVRIDNGRLRQRRGQSLMVPQDPLGIAGIPDYANYRCRKIFFYNNAVWGYFQTVNSNQSDVIGYFDTSIVGAGSFGQWILGYMDDYGFNFATDCANIPPQMTESNKRLLLATELGVYCSPKLRNDQGAGTLSTIQTQLRRAGCPSALPLKGLALFNGATYNSNWLAQTEMVAYRNVWKYVDANGSVSYGAVSDIRGFQNTTGLDRCVQMTIVIPLEIFNAFDYSRFSVQIYRTLTSIPSINGVTIDPGDQMFLVQQLRPTPTDVSNGFMYFIDIIDPIGLQAPLHTNQTQQGAAASRIRPPICKTLADFAGCAWFGNTTSRWFLPFSIGGVTDSAAATARGLQNNDIIIVGDYAYQAKNTVLISKNQFTLDTTAGYLNVFTRINNTVNNFHQKYNVNFTRTKYNLQTDSGPNNIVGQMILEQTAPGQLSTAIVGGGVVPYIGLYRQNGWPALSGSDPSPILPTPMVTEAVGKGFKIVKITGAGSNLVFYLNAAPDFIAGDTVNLARSVTYSDTSLAVGSQGNGTATFTAGQYIVGGVSGVQVTLTGVTGTITTQEIGVAPFATIWTNLGAMHCVTSRLTGLKTPAVGEQKVSPNRVMYSPYYEPESAPALNYFEIGASDKAILKLIRLNKSLFVFKQDGLFRITGSFPNFSVQQFDPNIILLGPDLVDTMGGALYCMTQKGVYMVSQGGSKRISYDIQNQIERVTWVHQVDCRKTGFAVGNDEDNSISFWLTDINANAGDPPTVAYVFDGQGWTKRTDQASSACCGRDNRKPSDLYSLYTMKRQGSGWLTKQRKPTSGIQLCDQSLPMTIVAINGPLDISVNIISKAGVVDSNVIVVGSVVVFNSLIASRAVVTGLTDSGGGSFQFTLQFINPALTTSSWTTGAAIIYTPIPIEWKYGVNGTDNLQNRKHFSDVGLVFQQPYFSYANIGFSSDIRPAVTYLNRNLAGFVLESSQPAAWPINQLDGTLADKTIEALVSSQHQRCSQLSISVYHARALQYISVYGHFARFNTGGKNIERNNGR